MPETSDWSETIRHYGDEMRRLYQKSGLPEPAPAPDPVVAAAAEPIPEPEPMPEPEPAPVRETVRENTPAPPFGNESGGTAQPGDPFSPPNNPNETDVGILSVRLVSARGTIPIAGATVTVFRMTADGARLYYIGETDENGASPEWVLPTLDRELSLEPGVTVPYVNYSVQANAAGFAAVLNEGVAVFGGVKTFQRIMMLPLPEPAADFEDTLLVTRPQSPENDLNGGGV